jgi:hypothetical protein
MQRWWMKKSLNQSQKKVRLDVINLQLKFGITLKNTPTN